MTKQDFLGRVATAPTGARIVYHTGFLLRDRKLGGDFMAVEATATAAFSAMEQGEIRLWQHKVGSGHYEYVAEKLAAPHVPVNWEGCYVVDKYLNPPRSRRDKGSLAAVVASARAARSIGAPTGAYA